MSSGTTTPAVGSTSWGGFLKTISSFSGDLSSLTAPPFILSTTSLTEYSAYWVSDPELLLAPTEEKDPEKRAVLVLKWFLSTLKQQYSSRNEHLGSEKKPLNPFLGELFLATWGEDKDRSLQLVSEQVSHHPPVTAYSIFNPAQNVQLQGYNGQKASVSKSLTINIKQVGHAIFYLADHKESYLITLPSLHIEGLMTGAPYVELNKHSWIVSSSGFVSKISYSGRGWLSGTKNSFTATIWHRKNPKSIIYTADGQWTGAFHIKDASKKEVASWDPKGASLPPPIVKPIEEQEPLESRRAWQKVAEGIRSGDMDLVGREKNLIEEAQRETRKKEKEEQRVWERKYFERHASDPVFEALSKEIGEVAEPEKTDGVWVWKAGRAVEAETKDGVK